MELGELEKHTTNEDLLGGILATLNRVELLLSQQNQPRPSGLSEDSARDSGDAERHCDREDDKNEEESGNEQEGEGGVNEENQEDGKEADDANQADENEAENENQQHDDEAEEWTSCGRKGDVESVAEPAMSNIANKPEFGEVIGFGDRMPHNPTYPLLFSQAFLEGFEPDEVKRRIGVIAKYLETVSQLDGLVKLDIIDFPIVDELYNTRSGTILDLHMECAERRRSIKRVIVLGGYIFHTTFFQLCQSHTGSDSWATGRLYSIGDPGGKLFRKACVTIHFSPETRHTGGRWTITILAPSNFYGSGDRFQYLRFPAVYGSHVIDMMMEVITTAVNLIVDLWQKLYDEVQKECDGENISFMDGEKYVHLLYDDSNFRRSRFYFWAIGCLSSFEQSVAETLWELSTFRTEARDKVERRRGVIAGSEKVEATYQQAIDDLDQAYKNLDSIRDQLVKKRDEMKVLRDGLFSASGVMESRQSRILGENVQLLAFVTIFFLPLAFSASLWSIPGVNEKYPGIMIPGAFAAIIGFITYFIVFNLNLLISGLRRLFSVPRSNLLTRMANEKYHPKYDSEDGSEDDSHGHPEGSSVKNTTSARSSVNNSTNARNSVSNSMREVRSVNNSIHEGRSVSNSIGEGRSVNNSINEGSSVNNSTNEGSSGNNSKSDGSGKKKTSVVNGKSSTDWPERAKAFEVFPHQDEGPRPSNWLLLFYAIRLLVLKTFDLVIGFLAWLREVIASDPSKQDPDTEMANRPTPRR
ncbi:hypothetical protein V501_02977 [Pseudogymnoascus sp. VKM F-4519 (FW-2642)]|nr:hypothetical protein V501_02977 [Pseudogymnoascus sp. VKM F-4519 (FW-2642)]